MREINKTGVFENKGRLYTIDRFKFSFFDEPVRVINKTRYRRLSPERSKLGAALKKGLSQTGIKEGSKVLYLGASHGYTPSYVSDIVGKGGVVFCVDIAPSVVRDLVYVCEQRSNMIPFLEDANKPENYSVVKEVDVVYQDIAQKDQVGIFMKNVDMFLSSKGFGLLALKARSYDVSRKPHVIYKEVKDLLEKKYKIVDQRTLDPFEKDHAFYVIKK